MTSRWVLRFVAVGIVVGLACENPDPIPERLLLEDFDRTRCDDAGVSDGLPCGWQQIGGDSGQALYGTTIHPGERGLILRGSGVTVRGPGGDPKEVTLQFGSVDARLSARCTEGSSILLRAAVVADPAPPGVSDTMEGRGTPPDDFVGETVVTMTATMALDPRSPFGMMNAQTLRVTGITLTKTGSGECIIDRIVIDQVGFREEPDSGC